MKSSGWRRLQITGRYFVEAHECGPVRVKLIKKGMIYSPAHGQMAFTVPMFDAFMVRAMPRFKKLNRMVIRAGDERR